MKAGSFLTTAAALGSLAALALPAGAQQGVTIVPEDRVAWGDSAPPPPATNSLAPAATHRSISPSSVPEPLPLTLFLLGGGLLARRRRK